MNLLHMKYAVEVARYGSINKASEKLLVAQPNLSRCIKQNHVKHILHSEWVYVPAENNRAVIANKIRFTYLTLTATPMRAPVFLGSVLFTNKVSGEDIS